MCRINKNEEINWKEYVFSIITVNAVMIFMGYIILRVQSLPILNPNKIGGMEQSLSFNTIISFITNTNLQDYSGESGLSNLSQMIVIIFMMFTSAATGFAADLANNGKENYGKLFCRFNKNNYKSFITFA